MPEGDSPLLLTAAELRAHYVWLESGAWDRRGARHQALDLRLSGPWDASALRRCATALLFYVAGYDRYFDESGYRRILSDLRPTEAGLAMYSAHLQQQLEFWRQLPAEKHRRRDEAKFRLRATEEVSSRFHTQLRLNPEQVRTRAARLGLDTHPCSGRFLRWHRDGSVEVLDPWGPLPRDERDDRRDDDLERFSLDG